MKRIWENWKAITEKVGNFQTGVVFSVLYFLILTPMGVMVSLAKDFLGVRNFPHWNTTIDNSSTLKKAKEQY